jgi:hypothetical protein
MCQSEASADEAAVAEEPLELARRGVGDDVEVLGLAAEQQVAHATSHKIGDKTFGFKAIEHPDGIGAKLTAGDGVRLSGDYARGRLIHDVSTYHILAGKAKRGGMQRSVIPA